ncbi:MAG: cation:H+ antiporter, partial [Acidimicrobiaceae bacterium]|nr:cation:H+ antiporter [Acidimicrobiaceae bacterium]
MTTTGQDLAAGARHHGRNAVSMAVAVAATVPGIFLRVTGSHVSDPADALLFGLAIVGSAFLLSWAAEVAQLDISAGLAIAVLAFIAVLPEYAVDLVFARKGGNAVERFGPACRSAADIAAKVEAPCSLALANMTGANRLLIGVGWSMVAFIAWWRFRKRGTAHRGIELERSHSVELSYLVLATAYSLTLPLKGSITLFDAAVLVTIFVAYTIRISRAPAEEPHLVGPATLLATLRVNRRRAAVVLLFVVAAGVILLCAEHFAEALVNTGKTFHISEFLLVQWLAPLASESPELLVAGLFAWRLNTNAGLGTLVSSKVNQWTLLVGTLPIAFALSSGSLHGLPIIAQQREELLLTAAQSVFAVAILINLSMSNREALMLFGLFWAQFLIGAVVPEHLHGIERVVVSITYLVLGVSILVK